MFADSASGAPARCLALHALAVSCMQLGRLAEARRCVNAGLVLATEARLPARLAELQATSALLWFHAEAPDRALQELDRAVARAPRASLATLRGQRAHLLFRLGRFEEGLAETERALAGDVGGGPTAAPTLGRDPDTVTARILTNRALACAYRGRHPEALTDLERSLGLYRGAGAEALVAQTLHNLAFVAGRAGDVPRAQRLYDEARAAYERLGLPLHQLMVDCAELHAEARLIPEAKAALAAAADALSAAGFGADAADAKLALAEACLAAGDPQGALAAAEEAGAAFARQGRASWEALAHEVAARVLREELEAAGDWRRFAASARASARALRLAGWPAEALQVGVAGARTALFAGTVGVETAGLAMAQRVLAEVGSPDLRSADRLAAAHAEALELLTAGDAEAALVAIRAGLDAPTEAVPGSDRSAIAALRRPGAPAMAETAAAIALRTGSPDRVLEWAERSRRLGDHMLRRAGMPLDAVLENLGPRTLVEFVAVLGTVHAVVVSEQRLDLVHCGRLDRLAEPCAELLFGLRRIVSVGASRADAATSTAMWTVLRRALSCLDRMLGRVFGGEGAHTSADLREVVVVPTGPLHAVPWGLLPSFAERSVTVARSALACPRPHRIRTRGVLLVAGPGPASADEEVERLSQVWHRGSNSAVRVLTGSAASREAVLDASGRADVVHLATHGRFRADSPAMSLLDLSDGPITLHELARGRPIPECLVLSACDAGRFGSEAHGLADGDGIASVLDPGPGETAFTIASVTPVMDRVMPAIAVRLHERLAAGDSPPDALTAARRATASVGSEDERLAAASLVCHGATGPPDGATSAVPTALRARSGGLPGAASFWLGESSA